MNALTVVDVAIRQDEQGRYCLNDLHKAAGGMKRHAPNEWLRNKQTKALVEAINRKNFKTRNGLSSDCKWTVQNWTVRTHVVSSDRESPVRTVSAGKPETFVVKQLVYAYAMWISADFNLAVIEAYDALVTGEYVQPAIQVESYWFARRPHWPPIRVRVLAGEAYRAIAEALHISRGRVARAVKSMINVGLLDPAKVAQVQHGPARKAALRYGESWAKPWQQMELLTA